MRVEMAHRDGKDIAYVVATGGSNEPRGRLVGSVALNEEGVPTFTPWEED